ncbi:MAG: hypothetical protein KKD17_05265 [Nanoarchaeota archaeon]|nr:hypothetical protein [Nanoarchaeota archaeon]
MAENTDTKDSRFLAQVNLAALVRVSYETMERSVTAADRVRVTIDYAPLTGFLKRFGYVGSSGDLSFLRPESLPAFEAINEVVNHRIARGVGSGYVGLDDFSVEHVEELGRDDLVALLEQLRSQERPY